MHRVHQKHTLKYSPEQLYQLVGDIERYPEFLPWCQEVKILRRRDQECHARVTVGFKGIRQTYQCRVLWQEHSIVVEYLSGPLADLYTCWTFHALKDPNHCMVEFQLEFALRNRLFGAIMEQVMLGAITRMTDAFVDRASVLYST